MKSKTTAKPNQKNSYNGNNKFGNSKFGNSKMGSARVNIPRKTP